MLLILTFLQMLRTHKRSDCGYNGMIEVGCFNRIFRD